MAEVLVDTDVFVDHLRAVRRLSPGKHNVHYSAVTRCELFAARGIDEEIVSSLLGSFKEIEVDHAIAERAGRLKRETRVRTPDALIAATALERGLTLVTRNTKDFDSVPGLRILASV